MLRSLRFLVLVVAVPAYAEHVVFVDNSKPSGGVGSVAAPFTSIAAAIAQQPDVVSVAQTDTPYVESVTLRKGTMLVGSAYGLDALAAELKTDFDFRAAARQGTGPIIQGTIVVTGDNVIAGCTLVAMKSTSAIVSSGAIGTLTLRDVSFRTSQRSFAIVLQQHQGAVSIIGGGVAATEEGSGLLITGGYGDVMIERFPFTGSFGNAVRISDRDHGAITLRNGSALHVDDAGDDAVVITRTTTPVTFADRVQIRGRRRGVVSLKAARLTLSGGNSWIETNGAAALDLRDSTVDIVLDSVSSSNAVEGVIADKVRGRLDVRGVNGEAGSGGAIRGAKNFGVRIVQSSNVRLSNMTIAASGSNGVIKGAKCAGEFDVNTTAPCNAALYLRHLQSSSFENIVIDGGGAMGLNANNLRDVTFAGLEVRGTGDESFEAGVLLQEVSGEVKFNRCTFTDNAGGEVLIEQRFNRAHVVFDRCLFAAPTRPTIATDLLQLRSLGNAWLDVELHNDELRDNAGGAISATASGSSSLILTITDTTGQRFGTGGVLISGRDAAHTTLAMTRTQLVAPAAPSVIDLAAEGSSTACIDLTANALNGGARPIRLTARSPQAAFRFVSNAANSGTVASALAAANGGAVARIEVAAEAISIASSCR